MWQDASSSTVQMSRKDAGPRILWPRGKHSIVEQVSLKLWGRDSTKGASSKRYPSHNRIWTRHVNKLGTQTRLQECANTSNYKKDNTQVICALRHKKNAPVSINQQGLAQWIGSRPYCQHPHIKAWNSMPMVSLISSGRSLTHPITSKRPTRHAYGSTTRTAWPGIALAITSTDLLSPSSRL